MATPIDTSVGAQPGQNAQQFLGLMAPIHLPTLASTNGADTPHLPIPHHTAALEVSSINDTMPMRTGYDFGSQEEFQYLSNTNEILTKCTLVVKLAALDASSGSGNNGTVKPRYVDDILNAAIEKVEWLYGSTASTNTIYGDENHFATFQETGDSELDRKMVEQACGLSTDERYLLAQSAQQVQMELPFYWSKTNAGHWHSYALGRPLKVRITWRSPTYLLQQTGTDGKPVPKSGSLYITDKWLHFDTVVPTEATKAVYRSKIEGNGTHGWLQLFKDVQIQEFDIAASGADCVQKDLRTDMFTRYGYNLRFVMRPLANLQPSYLNNERWKTLAINSAQFDIANKTYFPRTSDFDLKHVINARKFLGNHELSIYNIPLCSYPDMHLQAMGGIEFSNTSLPILKLWYDSIAAYTQGVRVTCFLYCHNYVREVIQGTNSATETVQPI